MTVLIDDVAGLSILGEKGDSCLDLFSVETFSAAVSSGDDVSFIEDGASALVRSEASLERDLMGVVGDIGVLTTNNSALEGLVHVGTAKAES